MIHESLAEPRNIGSNDPYHKNIGTKLEMAIKGVLNLTRKLKKHLLWCSC